MSRSTHVPAYGGYTGVTRVVDESMYHSDSGARAWSSELSSTGTTTLSSTELSAQAGAQGASSVKTTTYATGTTTLSSAKRSAQAGAQGASSVTTTTYEEVVVNESQLSEAMAELSALKTLYSSIGSAGSLYSSREAVVVEPQGQRVQTQVGPRLLSQKVVCVRDTAVRERAQDQTPYGQWKVIGEREISKAVVGEEIVYKEPVTIPQPMMMVHQVQDAYPQPVLQQAGAVAAEGALYMQNMPQQSSGASGAGGTGRVKLGASDSNGASDSKEVIEVIKEVIKEKVVEVPVDSEESKAALKRAKFDNEIMAKKLDSLSRRSQLNLANAQAREEAALNKAAAALAAAKDAATAGGKSVVEVEVPGPERVIEREVEVIKEVVVEKPVEKIKEVEKIVYRDGVDPSVLKEVQEKLAQAEARADKAEARADKAEQQARPTRIHQQIQLNSNTVSRFTCKSVYCITVYAYVHKQIYKYFVYCISIHV